MKKTILFAENNNIGKEQYGYTIVEILLVTSIIGLTLSTSLPLFGAVLNKVKQKEGTLIVNSILKTVKANYALESFLPNRMKYLSKFASFQKCISDHVEIKGSKVCNSNTIAKTNANDNFFYSPSGNYKVEIKTTSNSTSDIIFQVRAIPNGMHFQDKGSSVTGCFNPLVGESIIKEYSFFNVGEKEFISCFTALQIKKEEEARIAKEARIAEEAKRAEEARIAEEARKAEEAKRAEEVKPKCIYWNPRNPSQCFRYK